MSAIWGYIAVGEKQLDSERVSRMEESVNIYKLDRIEQVKLDDAYLGCGHQFITPESVHDASPIYDAEKNMYFAGDCFLYNRSDIFTRLKEFPEYSRYLKNSSPDNIGDCQLAYIAWKLMGDDFVTLIRGAFTFAVYYANERVLHLFSDHLCKRYLAYYTDKDMICFASTLKPVKACLNEKLRINREFIIRAYRTMAPMMFYAPEMSVYEGVNQLMNATHVVIDCKRGVITDQVNYWDPIRTVKPLTGKTDDEYKELFLKTYQKIVTAQLRSIGETGIMLSGGLDSSSVTAFAAPALKKQGKNLYSYTSVPHPDYEPNTNTPMVEDESPLIKEQCKYHSNLCPRFVWGDDSDCLGTADYFHKIFDIPVKPSINNLNIDNMSREAVRDHCKILLGAANGNATVSYGNIGPYISMSLLEGHPISAFREMFAYCSRYHLSKKRYLKAWLRTLILTLCKKPKEYSYFLKDEDMKKYHLEHFTWDKQKEFGTEFFVSRRQRNNFLYMPAQYLQRNFFYTNQGLYYGYLELDPTMTVEMIELCASLPLDCFVHNGVERRLISGYMKDLLPPAITDIHKGFGMQAADCDFRVNRNWDKIKDSVYKILSDPVLCEYMDEREISILIENIRKNEYHLDHSTVVYATLLSSLGYFLRDFAENQMR